MARLLVLILTITAVGYGIYLKVFSRPMPEIPAGGFKRRFYLAVAVCLAFLNVSSCQSVRSNQGAAGPGSDISSQTRDSFFTDATARRKVLYALRAIWRTLDVQHNEAFEAALESQVQAGHIEQRSASVLQLAFSELAAHRRLREGRVMCYRSSPLGYRYITVREEAQKQIEFLREAANRGRVTRRTAQRAEAAIARELEMFRRFKALQIDDQRAQQALFDDQRVQRALWERYRAGKVVASEPAQAAAAIIVALELEDNNR